MTATNHAVAEHHLLPSARPSHIPVRKLALATALACIVAQLLARPFMGPVDVENGPIPVVIGQALWNAAQVGHLLLLLCLWNTIRRWWIGALAVLVLLCLPFAIYVTSPGALAQTALLLASCALVRVGKPPNLSVALLGVEARYSPPWVKFEFLAFTCMLGSSLYNYNASRLCWPYWASIFEKIETLSGFSASSTEIARFFYTAGLQNMEVPAFIAPARTGGDLGALVFLLIWTVLPALYVLYFSVCAKMAKDSPGTRLQQALCIFCIVHFLFLTDFVDYGFGRGVINPAAEWVHWSERFVWRIAILLPIYQKLATRFWRTGNGLTGLTVHYGIAVWATGFFIYQVLIYDLLRFYYFVMNQPFTYFRVFGVSYRQELGYHGALVLMTLFYGFCLVGLRCLHFSVTDIDQETEPNLPQHPVRELAG